MAANFAAIGNLIGALLCTVSTGLTAVVLLLKKRASKEDRLLGILALIATIGGLAWFFSAFLDCVL